MGWQIGWCKASFTIQPGADTKKVKIPWNVYRVQHWRSPVLLVAHEDAVLEPGEQIILPVSHSEHDFEGLTSRAGLITTVRNFAAVTNGYGVPYMYGEDVNKIFVINLTTTTMRIKKGHKVAEFHPRSPKDLIFNQETPILIDGINEGKDTVGATESFLTDAKNEVSIRGVDGDRSTNPV